MEGAETTGFTRMSVEELKSGVGAPLSGTKNCMAGGVRVAGEGGKIRREGRAVEHHIVTFHSGTAHSSTLRSL
jgi:hypothetical protein